MPVPQNRLWSMTCGALDAIGWRGHGCGYLTCGFRPSMAVVGASSLQAFQTESVVTVKRQLQAEPDNPAFCCNSCLVPKAISSWVRSGDLIVLNASIFRQPRNPRLGRRWKLFRYSAFGEPAVVAELDNEDSEATAAEFLFTEDKRTFNSEASRLVEDEKTSRAEAPAWSHESCLAAQPQDQFQETRPWRGLAPESQNPSEDAAAANVYSSRDSPWDPVETVQRGLESPAKHLDGEWSDAGSKTEVPAETQRTDFETDERKELDPHRVYVGGIAFNFQGQELRKALRQLFSQFGPIRSLDVAVFGQDNTYVQENGRHRGFAYVVMEDPEDAKAAITCLNGQYYWGRNLMVRQAYKKVEERKLPDRPCQLYVGNLNKTITNRELRKIFKRFGHVIQTKVIKEYISGKSRGFAFVTFAEEEEGKRAVQHLHGYILGNSALVVNISKEPRIKGPNDVPTDAYSSVLSTEV